MRCHPIRTLGLLLLATAALLVLPACGGRTEIQLHNATKAPLRVVLQVDRLRSGPPLAELDLQPDQRGTLGPADAPPLEYLELAIWRQGDLADVPTTLRVPAGDSAWTLAPDPEAWTGLAIVRGIQQPLINPQAEPPSQPNQ